MSDSGFDAEMEVDGVDQKVQDENGDNEGEEEKLEPEDEEEELEPEQEVEYTSLIRSAISIIDCMHPGCSRIRGGFPTSISAKATPS